MIISVLLRIWRRFYRACVRLAGWIDTLGLMHWWNVTIRGRVNSPNILTQEQRKAVRKFYAPWFDLRNLVSHTFYTEKTGRFCVEYVPDAIYYPFIDRFYGDWQRSEFFNNKCFYTRIFPNARQPRTIAYRCNGIWFDENWQPCADLIHQKISGEQGCLFVKIAEASGGGHGVFCIENAKDMVNEFVRVIGTTSKDLVVQAGLRQHEVLAKINPTSVNTFRILSMLRRDGSVKVYSSIVRMGMHGSRVDNASSGGITCGIDENGHLKDVAYSAAGEKHLEHPDSKVKFGEIVIPQFRDCLAFVKSLHCQIPHFRLVSWDVALDEMGCPVLIESNMRWGELDFHQLNNGPLFGEDLQQILDEVFGSTVRSRSGIVLRMFKILSGVWLQ